MYTPVIQKPPGAELLVAFLLLLTHPFAHLEKPSTRTLPRALST